MLSAEHTNYSSDAAGKALASDAWNQRKQQKLELSAKYRASAMKNHKQLRHAAQSLAEAADVFLDGFIERVEHILRRDGAEEFLAKLDSILPEKEPNASLR